MIGSGQHVRLQMWGVDGETIQDGVLPPGMDTDLTFTDGAQVVARIALTRFTKEEADRMEAWYEANGTEKMYERSIHE